MFCSLVVEAQLEAPYSFRLRSMWGILERLESLGLGSSDRLPKTPHD
jgi:hypothetical protein